MGIKTKWVNYSAANRERGQNLAELYRGLGMDRRAAAGAIGLSVVRLYLLEGGEVGMEDESMWKLAFDAVAARAKIPRVST